MSLIFRLWPQDDRSGGMRMIYHLFHLLFRMRYDVALNRDPGPDDVVIYPDNYPGHPFGGERCVRYMCYFASMKGFGYNDGVRIPAQDCVILYHEDYRQDVAAHYDGSMRADNVVTMPSIEDGLFYPEPKEIDKVLYVGKPCCPVPADWRDMVLTKLGVSRAKFAAVLRRARNVYLLDLHTVVKYEAALAGCQPWQVYPDGHSERINVVNPEAWVMDPEGDKRYAARFVQLIQEHFADSTIGIGPWAGSVTC